MDTKIIELKKMLAAKVAEAEKKAKTPEGELMTEEQAKEVARLYGEADLVKAQLDLLEKGNLLNVYLEEPSGTKAAHFRPAADGEGDHPFDPHAWRELEVKVGRGSDTQVKVLRYHVPLAVQQKGYASAVESYVRKGINRVGPNDRKLLEEALDTAGGFLVPEDMMGQIIKKIAARAVFRNFARVVTTGRDMVTLIRRKYTTDNQYTSGARLTWTGETPSSATAHRITDQVYGELNVPVNTAMASQLISKNLLEDSAYDVLDDSSSIFAEAFALGEENVFWRGTGAGQPRGLLVDASDTVNWDAQVQTAATANAIDADEVIDVAYALPEQYELNARWFMTKATEKYIRKLKDSSSDYIWPIVSQVGGLGGIPGDLLDFPRSRVPFMDNISDATNTTTHPLVFGISPAIPSRTG